MVCAGLGGFVVEHGVRAGASGFPPDMIASWNDAHGCLGTTNRTHVTRFDNSSYLC